MWNNAGYATHTKSVVLHVPYQAETPKAGNLSGVS